MIKKISILGSTGSIGKQSISVARRHNFKISALSAFSNIDLIETQAREFKPEIVSVFDENAAKELKIRLIDTDIKVLSGMAGLLEVAQCESADAVITAVSGAVGLRPTLAAIEAKKRIALANKETLVCAGKIVMQKAKNLGVEIIPVDSEHSAIFQCVDGKMEELQSIILTASGGPFRNLTREETKNVTPEMAVKHPNWSMGAKISVDSATMMNKGLEFIEAMHLFAVKPSQIQVLIHPESIIHSAAEFIDGAVIAQMGVPDMELPIQYALTYPRRISPGCERLSLAEIGKLSFSKPDLERFHCLKIAISSAERGGTAPAIMNAANEIAVSKFLQGKIGYNDIYNCVASALDSICINDDDDLETIIEADRAAREHVNGEF